MDSPPEWAAGCVVAHPILLEASRHAGIFFAPKAGSALQPSTRFNSLCSRRRKHPAICCNHRRNLTMNRHTTVPLPIAVDVAVTLTAIVRPEPDAGGYSASIPAL